MLAYIIRRLFLIIPTLFAVMVVNFAVLQFLPGGPVEQLIAQIQGTGVEATARFGSGAQSDIGPGQQTQRVAVRDAGVSRYRGAQGLDPEFIRDLERQFGFDTWWVDPTKESDLERRKQRMAQLPKPNVAAKADTSGPSGSGAGAPAATQSGTGVWLALGAVVAVVLIGAGVIIRRRRSGAR